MEFFDLQPIARSYAKNSHASHVIKSAGKANRRPALVHAQDCVIAECGLISTATANLNAPSRVKFS
jgi:hypothetical protein